MSGCAIGNKYMIDDVQAQLEATGEYPVVVASWDQRQFIVDKKSPDTYVGRVRGRYGIPFNATTLGGLPFADAVSQSICKALIRKGFKATPISVPFDLTEKAVRERILSNKEDRALFVTIRQWESDSFMNLNVGYDFSVEVIARDGTLLATAQAKEDIKVPGRIWKRSLKMSKKEVPNILKKAIESLLNNPEVVKALDSKHIETGKAGVLKESEPFSD